MGLVARALVQRVRTAPRLGIRLACRLVFQVPNPRQTPLTPQVAVDEALLRRLAQSPAGRRAAMVFSTGRGGILGAHQRQRRRSRRLVTPARSARGARRKPRVSDCDCGCQALAVHEIAQRELEMMHASISAVDRQTPLRSTSRPRELSLVSAIPATIGAVRIRSRRDRRPASVAAARSASSRGLDGDLRSCAAQLQWSSRGAEVDLREEQIALSAPSELRVDRSPLALPRGL